MSDRVDFEGELAVVIGKGGKNISQKKLCKVLQDILVITMYLLGITRDITVSSFQEKTSQKQGLGPFLKLASSIKNYESLTIKTILNGEVMQEAKLDQLIFKIPEIISYISSFTPLVAGDIIVTGTPGGVGDRRDPPLYMKNGDIVEVEISEVGKLVNPVLDENIIL